MIELDAEKGSHDPAPYPRKRGRRARLYVEFPICEHRRYFRAPKEIIDIINKMQAIEEPKALAPAAVDETTAGALNLNENGEVEIPREQIIGTASELFGDKVYADVEGSAGVSRGGDPEKCGTDAESQEG